MILFLATLARDAVLTGERVEDFLDTAEPGLTFRGQPYWRDVWTAPHGRAALVAWCNETDLPESRQLISHSGNFAKLMSGHVRAPGVADPWNTEEVLAKVQFRDTHVPALGGVWALLKVSGEPVAIDVFNTVSRWVPVYFAETENEIFISNRALVLALLLSDGARQKLKPEVLVSSQLTGQFATEDTPFAGVNVMPPHSRLTATVDGVRCRQFDGFRDSVGKRPYGDDAVEELASLFVETVGIARSFPLSLSLSGGMDSRLVAASFWRAGLPFTARTLGTVDGAEARVAAMVAKALGAEHQLEQRPEIDEAKGIVNVDLLARVHNALFLGDGMVFAWETFPPPAPFQRLIHAGGEGSAATRGGHAAKLSAPTTRTWKGAANAILARQRKLSPLLQPGNQARQQEIVEGWLKQNRQMGPLAAMDYYHIAMRVGRWFPSVVAPRFSYLPFQPFMDEQIVRASQRISPEQKMNDRLVYEITRTLAPSLSTIPLYGKRYLFEQNGPFQNDESGWQMRTPVMPANPVFDWRHAWTTALYDQFHEEIFDRPAAAALFEAVKRKELEDWFRQRRNTEPRVLDSYFAWMLLTDSVLLQNRWLEPADSGSVTSFALPKRTAD